MISQWVGFNQMIIQAVFFWLAGFGWSLQSSCWSDDQGWITDPLCVGFRDCVYVLVLPLIFHFDPTQTNFLTKADFKAFSSSLTGFQLLISLLFIVTSSSQCVHVLCNMSF